MKVSRRKFQRPIILLGVVAVGLVLAILWRTGFGSESSAAQSWPIPEIDTAGMMPIAVRVIEESRAALEREPTSPLRWLDYGSVLQAHDLLETAAEVLGRAETLEPDDPRVHHLLALLGPPLGQPPEEILARWERVKELDPRYPPVYVRLGDALIALDRLDEASEAYRRAIELDPTYPMAHRQLGLVALDTDRTSEALRHLTFARELVPNDRGSWLGLARVYQRLGRVDLAAEAAAHAESGQEVMSFRDGVWEQMYWRNLSPLRQMERAERLVLYGNHRDAATALRIALESWPDVPQIHRRLAESLAALGEFDRAAEYRASADRLTASQVDD